MEIQLHRSSKLERRSQELRANTFKSGKSGAPPSPLQNTALLATLGQYRLDLGSMALSAFQRPRNVGRVGGLYDGGYYQRRRRQRSQPSRWRMSCSGTLHLVILMPFWAEKSSVRPKILRQELRCLASLCPIFGD